MKKRGAFFTVSVLLSYGIALIGCQQGKKKATEKSVKADSGNVFVKPQDKNTDSHFLIPIDTIIGKDTIKVKWYQNGLVCCSLNSMSDTITNTDVKWDPVDFKYLKEEGLKRIILQGEQVPLNLVMSDKIIIINLVDWKGRAVLFLLNRTINEIKFTKQDEFNPIAEESGYVYVDLKNGVILDHGRQDNYDHGKNADAGDDKWEGSPYWIYRFKIKDNRFVQTDLDTSFFKEFLKLDLGSMEDNRTFYTILLKKENWQRDRYVTSGTIKGK
ncbi:MAG TPA: hypothetical protein VK809_09295 [Bacteroidia bacterium]|nr:hypothetical protein [Bacteroidia bacterium]